uniref:Protein kinase domain-containing protein n=2 Tax=Macrostomum lignano TaxID=282301 RepID=A0A1I8I9N6_9PLAT
MPAKSCVPVPYLLLVLLLSLAPAEPTTCQPGQADCVIRDVSSMSGMELFNRRLSESTVRLTLINVTFSSWPDKSAIRASSTAARIRSLTLDRVGGSAIELNGILPSLVQLRLSNCCPMPLGAPVTSLNSLQELSIVGGCKIDTLNSSWLGRLPSLQTLTIDSAMLDNLNLADLPQVTRDSLQEVKLTNNNFKKLEDDAFGSMPNLRSLILDGNIVQYIQIGAFQRLPKLRELSIVLPLPKEGVLAKIWEPLLDGRFDNNTELETLRLVNARLAEDQIPNALDRLQKLRRLDLSGHRFRRLSNGVLAGLTGLRELDLSNGSLACLFDRNFGIMKWLEQLNLANNDIRVIGQRALLGLASLSSLDLSGNPIKEVQQGAFCSLPASVKQAPSPLASFNFSSTISGAVNLSEPCPEGFDPNRLVLSSRPQCLMPKPRQSDSNGNGKSGSGNQSRHTFLIIIGLCVAFLLITVISMMAYKGWSKRKNAELARDEEKELELQAMVAAADAPAASGGSNGNSKKPPNNGRHHRHSGGGKSSSKKSPSAAETPSGAQQGEPGAAEGAAEVEVVRAQVESPGKAAAAASTPTEPSAAPAEQNPSAPGPQLRPGVTLMTSVPEDSDLEARAITTLVVVQSTSPLKLTGLGLYMQLMLASLVRLSTNGLLSFVTTRRVVLRLKLNGAPATSREPPPPRPTPRQQRPWPPGVQVSFMWRLRSWE